ncbi:MAG TPA: LCP family protein [Propionibacteriaceae bacterium]|nr:LCP family protein [Propionibacteriaceae bacterium]
MRDTRRPHHADADPRRALDPRDDFRRTALYTVVGTLLPGLGLILARRRVIGGIILGVFVAALITLGAFAAVDMQRLAALAVRPDVLRRVTVALIVVALVWVGVIVASHLALRHTATGRQRALGGLLVSILAFAVAAPMAVAARYSHDQAGLVNVVFKREDDTKSATRPTLATTDPAGKPIDPWQNRPRLNVLLLGGDAGPDREGTRTDTAILASIDTHTGDTTLFSLPRNTGRMPFPKASPLHKYFPHGFTNGNGDDPEFFLNAMYGNLPNTVPKTILGPTDNFGADALKLSVGEALGLKVDYYVLVNLGGFKRLINALGGITVNVNTYIPMGGNTDLGIPPKEYIKPGPNQKLNGDRALWYARGRYGSTDFDRMDRQRCVINAIIKQANPGNLLARYEAIARAGKNIVTTDVQQEVLPMMVDLALRVKDGNVRSIVFKHGVAGFSSPDPDFARMRQRVRVALGETKATSPRVVPKPQTSTTPKAKPTAASRTAKPTAQSEDIVNSCAWKPQVAATAEPVR